MIEVKIEKMTLGGNGIARLPKGEDENSGLVLFVPFSVPGDVLRVRVTEKKKNFAFAEIVEIVKPSPDRIQPPCPVFGECGGCNWQQLQYPAQLQQKQAIVVEQLARVLTPQTEVLPIVPSPREFRYRNRIQVHTQDEKWGYFARKSHRLIETHDCLIAEEALIKKLESLEKRKPSRVQVSLQQDQTVTLENSDSRDDDADDLGFSQVNRFQNQTLIETVLQWTGSENPWPEIWDLYAGSGNFTFPLYEKYKKSKLVAVELSKKNVYFAQSWLKDNNVSPQRLKFVLSDVEIFLKRAIMPHGGLVLLDPPRNGCSPQALQYLKEAKIKKLLYLSCNPATLARDLSLLLDKGSSHFRLSRVQAFDMFPQTDHVEVLTELLVDDIPH